MSAGARPEGTTKIAAQVLGLPLTKSLVELHSGSLDLQSDVGVGTTVTVRFPAERIIHPQRETETLGTSDRQAS